MKIKWYIVVTTTDGQYYDVEDLVIERETQFEALKDGMAIIEQEVERKGSKCIDVRITDV